jgi:leucyl-tRNA synthetase
MVTHETYKSLDGRWLAPDEVDVREGSSLVEVATGSAVERGRIEKMSKSKRNTIDPEPIVNRYGADAVRWFMLSDSPPERDLEWSESGIEGAARFVQRVWRLVQGAGEGIGRDAAVEKKLNRAVAAVGDAIECLQFNKAVAQLYELVGSLEKAAPSASRDEAIRTMVRLIAPMAPHLAEECWAAFGETNLVALADWPSHDPALLIDSEVTVAVQVNGKLRDTLSVPRGLDRADLESRALASGNVQRQLAGSRPRKVIVVPDRLVNIVA